MSRFFSKSPKSQNLWKEFTLSFQRFVAHPTQERSRTFINVRHHGRMKILRTNSVIRLDDSCHQPRLLPHDNYICVNARFVFAARLPEDTSIEDASSSFRCRCRPLENNPAIGRFFINNLRVNSSRSCFIIPFFFFSILSTRDRAFSKRHTIFIIARS